MAKDDLSRTNINDLIMEYVISSLPTDYSMEKTYFLREEIFRRLPPDMANERIQKARKILDMLGV